MKLHNTTTFVYTNQPLYCDCFMQTKVFYISISYSEIQFYLIHSFFITTVHSNNLYVKSIVIFIDVRWFNFHLPNLSKSGLVKIAFLKITN